METTTTEPRTVSAQHVWPNDIIRLPHIDGPVTVDAMDFEEDGTITFTLAGHPACVIEAGTQIELVDGTLNDEWTDEDFEAEAEADYTLYLETRHIGEDADEARANGAYWDL